MQPKSGRTSLPLGSGRTGVPPVQDFVITKRKLPHWQIPGETYFLTFSALEGEKFSSEERDIILNSCLFWKNKKYILYAVIVMPTHVHLLLQPLPVNIENTVKGYHNISKIMHSIKSFSSHKINDIRKSNNSIWLPEFYDRIVRDKKDFEEKLQYIYDNPLRSDLTDIPEHYKWFWMPSGETPEVPTG